MSDTQTRPATQADVPALARLGRESFVAKFGHLYKPSDLARFLEEVHSEAAVAGEMANPLCRYRVAEEAGALTGYCKLSLACGWPEYARGARAIELKQLYTAPGMGGRGIGAALIDWALATAREHGADEIQLSVYSDNAGAQRFYQRYGFEKIADITFAVGDQLDEEFLFGLRL